MKTFFPSLILILSGTVPNNIKAQTLSVQADGVEQARDSVAEITSFTGKYNTGKIYLKWTVCKQQADGMYLIYRSENGINYESIGSKQGIGEPITKDIEYYFLDDNPIAGESHYKIIHLANNKTFLCSEKIDVNTEMNEVVLK